MNTGYCASAGLKDIVAPDVDAGWTVALVQIGLIPADGVLLDAVVRGAGVRLNSINTQRRDLHGTASYQIFDNLVEIA